MPKIISFNYPREKLNKLIGKKDVTRLLIKNRIIFAPFYSFGIGNEKFVLIDIEYGQN